MGHMVYSACAALSIKHLLLGLELSEESFKRMHLQVYSKLKTSSLKFQLGSVVYSVGLRTVIRFQSIEEKKEITGEETTNQS